MQTDTTPYSQTVDGWIVALNWQITKVAARNKKIVWLSFHRHATC